MADLMLTIQCIGAALMLIAYFGMQAEFWSDLDDRFLILNIIGAAMLAATAWIEGQWGFAVLNTVWGLAALRSFGSMRQG